MASLKAGAVNVVHLTGVALSSTAPAYSIVAGLVVLVDAVGVAAPWAVLAGVVPMLLLASTFRSLNAVDPDCGTSFAWTSRAFGHRIGWLTGWLSLTACVLVMASLAQIGSTYLLHLLGADAPHGRLLEGALGLLLVGALSVAASLDITLTARVQMLLAVVEIGALLTFAVVALAGTGRPTAPPPVGHDWIGAALAATFLYWGWDSAYNLNEESDAPRSSPAVAAAVANYALALVYTVFAWAVSALLAGPGASVAGGENGLLVLAEDLPGGAEVALLLNVVVVVSVLGCLQTTILPSARIILSMARAGVLPGALSRVDDRYRSPRWATLCFAVASMLTYAGLLVASLELISDVVEATSVLIAGYYATTCFAATLDRRRETRRTARRSLPAVPLATGAIFTSLAFLGVARLDLPAVVALIAILSGVTLTAIRCRPEPDVATER